jgi:sugar lactone lactonase YvrE
MGSLLQQCISFILFVLSLAGTAQAQQYYAWTVAGGGQPQTPFAAVGESIGTPLAVAADAAGNVYFASAQAILRIDRNGILSLVAGDGRGGSTADGVPGNAAHISGVVALAADPAGNVYFADSIDRVRKVSTAGIVTTVAGTRTLGIAGDGGPATSALLDNPSSLAVDAQGNLYIADMSLSVRHVSPDGVISTVNTGPRLTNTVFELATDTAGNLYIGDNDIVYRVSADGTLTPVAGTGKFGSSGDGGPATAAALGGIAGLAFDAAGDLFIATNPVVRRVSTGGIISTVAGNAATSSGNLGDGGPATATPFPQPFGIAADAAGNLYIADTGKNRIRKVVPAGIITTIAGNGLFSFSGDGGPAPFAQLGNADMVATDPVGNIYIGDTQNNRVRRISLDGTITTVVGNGTAGFSGDGGPAVIAEIQFGPAVNLDFSPSRPEGVSRSIRPVICTSPTPETRVSAKSIQAG